MESSSHARDILQVFAQGSQRAVEESSLAGIEDRSGRVPSTRLLLSV